MARRKKESYTIQSVVHALELLEQFHGEEAELGVTELSRLLGLHKNNVFRILATLETRGYVVQDLETEGYSLGVKALELGRSYLRHSNIVSVVGPLLSELKESTQETAYLSILQGEQVVYLLAEEASRAVRVVSRVGQQLPSSSTVEGKVQLAFLESLPQKKHPLRRISDPRPADLRKLERELAKIRDQKYASDIGSNDPDVTAVSAAIFNEDGNVIGAISVHAPIFRASKDRQIKTIIGQVSEAAKQASHAMGAKNIDSVMTGT